MIWFEIRLFVYCYYCYVGECLRAEPEYFDNPPGLLNRTGSFVDALSLMAIWPVEMDDVRVIVCQVQYYAVYLLSINIQYQYYAMYVVGG